ncbi:MAG TPA: Ig-like domain repeat protein [Candidatus Acidoferrales bacterium]|nr:Ig-like domain repeat protein [Candidatus Acidoferrales bacterium]
MQIRPSRIRATFVCFVAVAAFAFILPAAYTQTLPIQSRIVQPIDPASRTVLKGNTYYLAQAKYDTGAAPASLPMQRMLLLLRRGPDQEAALEQLMQEQQNPASPNYHSWLTPQQFGAQFGPSAQDIQTVVSWLDSQGFAVNRVSNGATVIEFSGTAGQVQSAFRTTIHKYNVNGAEHWANSSDPSIPAALAPVVVGLDTLHNFPRSAMHVVSGVYSKNRSTGQVKVVSSTKPPLFTLGCGSTNTGAPITCFGLGPFDFATIYNVLPLWNASPANDGTGQTIAVIGETDVVNSDIESFQKLFGLPVKDPVFVVDGPDPGISPGDETESDLDLQWAGSIAKGATIKFVVAATTNTTLGVDLAAQFAVDQNIAPIISESYGLCEAAIGTAGNQFFSSMWQQAAAQGITVIIAAGDSGSAGCDSHDNQPPAPAEFGLQVSGFASTPYNVAVGGTDFNDLANPSTFWKATSDPTTQESAIGYIPEVPWNDTCTSAALSFFGFPGTAISNCNNPNLLQIVVNTVGGSGGKSSCTVGDGNDVTSCSGGYAKPSWQTGTGVPADGKRDIPDVSLFASGGFYTNSFYIICEADLTDGIPCDAQNGEFLAVGGTSASAPSFAGIMAMVDQKTAARQGNANYVLYNLAAQPGASCTSASATSTSSTCAFYDVTTGTNAMPCDGIPADHPVNCGTPGSEDIGILTGYTTNAGYDLATGLGSVNVANLVKNWTTFSAGLKPSATTLTLSPVTGIVHGTPVNVTVGVSAVAPATGTPTGNVALEAPPTNPGITSFVLTAAGVSSTTDILPGGSYNVTAHYPGDSTFSASDSHPVAVTVTPEPSSVAVSVITVDSNGNVFPFTSGTYGATVIPRVDVTGKSGNGFPSGNVTFKDNNQALTPALTLPLNSQGNALPTNPIFTFTAGSHSLSASYAGDASFNASASTTPATFTISQAATTISLSGPAGVTLGGTLTLPAILSATSCGNPPTGTVTLFDGTTQLGAPQPVQATSLPNCTIQATVNFAASGFPQGISSVTAKYSGDTNYTSSTSGPESVDAKANSTSTLSASPTTIQQGQSVTLTALVAASSPGEPALTGTVFFSLNGQNLGSSSVSNGQAQFTTTALPSGNDPVLASYSGDTNYNNSSSAVAFIQVNPGPDFSITFAPPAVVVPSQGASGSTVLTVTGTNGFNTAINFAAATVTGLPSESNFSFNPTSVAVGATTAMTITTTAPSQVVPAHRSAAGPSSRFNLPGGTVYGAQLARHSIGFVLVLLFGLLLATQLRQRRVRWLAPTLLLAVLLVNAACGGGGSSTATPPANPGTPKVQNVPVSVKVTSGTITHTFTFTLTVN